jgi:hypothetical protein
MTKGKQRPATYEISPELVEERDQEAQRNDAIVSAVRPKATLDPQLEAEKQALIAKEQELSGRSVMEQPYDGR